VSADERLPQDSDSSSHWGAEPLVFPPRLVVAHPVGGVALDTGKARTRQHKGPPVWHGIEQPCGGSHRHKQRVLIAITLVRVLPTTEPHRQGGDIPGRRLV